MKLWTAFLFPIARCEKNSNPSRMFEWQCSFYFLTSFSHTKRVLNVLHWFTKSARPSFNATKLRWDDWGFRVCSTLWWLMLCWASRLLHSSIDRESFECRPAWALQHISTVSNSSLETGEKIDKITFHYNRWITLTLPHANIAIVTGRGENGASQIPRDTPNRTTVIGEFRH